MTREEILAMVPGPVLDMAVAEKIFGYWWADGPKYDYDGPCEWERILVPPTMTKDQYNRFDFPPKGKISRLFFVHKRFSTDIAAAMEMEEIINKLEFSIKTNYVWYLSNIVSNWNVKSIDNFNLIHASATDRCKAALLAKLGVE